MSQAFDSHQHNSSSDFTAKFSLPARLITDSNPLILAVGDVVQDQTHQVNIYAIPGNPILTHGYFTDHGMLHTATINLLQTKYSANQLLIQQLYDYWASGSTEQTSLQVRIDTARDMSTEKAKQTTDHYQRVIEIAEAASKVMFPDNLGKVELLASTKTARQVLKKLGKLHLWDSVGQNNLSAEGTRGADYLVKHVQDTPAGLFYYSKVTGERYKTPQQILELSTKLDSRSGFINSLKKMLDWTDPNRSNPKSTNRAGRAEAQFLVYNSQSNAINLKANTELYQSVLNLFTLANGITKDQWHLPENLRKVEVQIELLAAQQRYLQQKTDETFKLDDFSNLNFVRCLEKLLRGVRVDPFSESGELNVPALPLDIGRIKSTPLGPCYEFNELAVAYPALRTLIEKLLLILPTGQEAEWLVVSDPLDPVTYEQRPAYFTRDFGEPHDHSLIVSIGRFNTTERHWVIRTPPFAEDFWLNTNTPRINELLKSSTAQQLAGLVRHTMTCQVQLFNSFCQILGTATVPVFKSIKIQSSTAPETTRYLYRELISGQRLDRADRMLMSSADMINICYELGKIACLNFIAARPVFPLHEIFLNKNLNGQISLASIGTSESFRNSLQCRDISEYLHLTSNLYAVQLFSWLAAFRYGNETKSISDPNSDSLKTLSLKIHKSFADGFIAAYNKLSEKSALTAFVRQVGKIKNSFDKLEKHWGNLPVEFDLRSTINQNIDLLCLSITRVHNFLEDVKYRAEKLQTCYSTLLGKQSNILAIEQHAELMLSLQALISNQYANRENFQAIEALLHTQSRDLKILTPTEKKWLITMLDQVAWFKAVDREDIQKMIDFTRSQTDSNSFVTAFEQEFPNAYLFDTTARRFFEAINGLAELLNKTRQKSDQKSERQTIQLERLIHQWSLGAIQL